MLAPNLRLVDSLDDILGSLQTFSNTAATNVAAARNMMQYTQYWVLDPRTGNFGPAKFVAFRGMTFRQRRAALQEGSTGIEFNGGVTHSRLDKLLGGFREEPSRHAGLREWAERLVGAGSFGNVDETKWRFALLRERRHHLLYWKSGSVRKTADNDPLNYVSSDLFERTNLAAGDVVWGVTSYERGRLTLVARIEVDTITNSRSEAIRLTKRQKVWPAKWYAIGVRGSARTKQNIELTPVAANLRFSGKHPRLPAIFSGQNLQMPRHLTPDSASLLEDAWNGTGARVRPIVAAIARKGRPVRAAAPMDCSRDALVYALDRQTRRMDPAHQNCQMRLKQYLEQHKLNAVWERDFVDVQWVGDRDTAYIGEVKLTRYLSLDEAFRTALGQLLVYGATRFKNAPGMVMFLDAEPDAKLLQLAERLDVCVVVEKTEGEFSWCGGASPPDVRRLFA